MRWPGDGATCKFSKPLLSGFDLTDDFIRFRRWSGLFLVWLRLNTEISVKITFTTDLWDFAIAKRIHWCIYNGTSDTNFQSKSAPGLVPTWNKQSDSCFTPFPFVIQDWGWTQQSRVRTPLQVTIGIWLAGHWKKCHGNNNVSTVCAGNVVVTG